eukprot:TRINITY_DN31957_c0_g1_i1.p1 TRINITY_DN31957_c0_g1~~TRINITY_DN31957_c0_g1_i1.p1  ORF type:complete len:200 (+),score=34.45 TRINITY_DN31957_c0_g1_i1:55-600(+)
MCIRDRFMTALVIVKTFFEKRRLGTEYYIGRIMIFCIGVIFSVIFYLFSRRRRWFITRIETFVHCAQIITILPPLIFCLVVIKDILQLPPAKLDPNFIANYMQGTIFIVLVVVLLTTFITRMIVLLLIVGIFRFYLIKSTVVNFWVDFVRDIVFVSLILVSTYFEDKHGREVFHADKRCDP